MSLLGVISLICSRKPDYYCPSCGTALHEQDSFDPDDSDWYCKECDAHLYDGQYAGVFNKDDVRYCGKRR